MPWNESNKVDHRLRLQWYLFPSDETQRYLAVQRIDVCVFVDSGEDQATLVSAFVSDAGTNSRQMLPVLLLERTLLMRYMPEWLLWLPQVQSKVLLLWDIDLEDYKLLQQSHCKESSTSSLTATYYPVRVVPVLTSTCILAVTVTGKTDYKHLKTFYCTTYMSVWSPLAAASW